MRYATLLTQYVGTLYYTLCYQRNYALTLRNLCYRIVLQCEERVRAPVLVRFLSPRKNCALCGKHGTLEFLLILGATL